MISTHILDTSKGQPASGVEVSLEKKQGAQWELVDQQRTNIDGRVVFNCGFHPGFYRLNFQTEAYFKKTLGTSFASFFADAIVQFNIEDTKRKYHIPLLLNPFGYSTYRGS